MKSQARDNDNNTRAMKMDVNKAHELALLTRASNHFFYLQVPTTQKCTPNPVNVLQLKYQPLLLFSPAPTPHCQTPAY